MSEPRLTNRTPYVVLGLVVLLAAGAFIGWRVYQGQQVPEPVVAVEPQAVDAGVVEPELPPLNLADGDAILKDSGISTDPVVLGWLAQPDIVRRLIAAVVQVGDGDSPRETLGFISVQGSFSVIEKGKKTDTKVFMSPASTARYDPAAKAIGSIDAALAGRTYAKVRPFAESVLREIGLPGEKLDAALGRAIDRLAAVPLSDEPLELAPLDVGIGYRYVDPTLEGLSRAQKHLLRMGPANARIVVAKLKEFQAASGQ